MAERKKSFFEKLPGLSSSKKSNELDQLWERYQKYCERCIEDEVVGFDGRCVCRGVRPLLVNDKGRFAVVVSQVWHGKVVAIHEINKDWSFSQRKPYFTKTFGGNWELSGAWAIVHFLRPENENANFEIATRSGNKSEVSQIGFRIESAQTEFRPMASWEDFKYRAQCDFSRALDEI